MTNKVPETNKEAPYREINKRKLRGWENFKEFWGEFWQEFKRIKYGIVGLVLFFIFVLIVIFEPLLIAFPGTNDSWRDITYWEDNPKSVPPAWTNYFSSKKKAVHEIFTDPELVEKKISGMKLVESTINYDYDFDLPPKDIIFHAYGKGNITLVLKLLRPDGQEIELLQKVINYPSGKDINISMANDTVQQAFDFGSQFESPENVRNITNPQLMLKPLDIFFAEGREGILSKQAPLKGDYQFKLSAVLVGKEAELKDPYLVMSGRVFGLLGTDNSKRDIWSGLIVGTKWALLIGLLTSFIAVVIGVVYGVTSAYYGGWVDSLMMRIFEIFVSIPILPVLIVLSAVFKPSIWVLILLMCIFFWVGPVRTVRSMALQIKEETYVEAAHALDASNRRIILKHMVPQLIPYAFASMALRVPSAIVFEASVSLLGLGDATIVTWGQILHDAMNGGAVLQNIWWWVIPPGIFIALMGMTFAFIGFAMDTILNPKLKTR